MPADWDYLRTLADDEVRATMKRLPPALRRQAQLVPVVCESRPNDQLIAEGYDPDLLGLFVGNPFADEDTGCVDVPPQILLFLENLWDLANGNERVYRDEVRTTYLHELGHYLGLSEIELEQRGLE